MTPFPGSLWRVNIHTVLSGRDYRDIVPLSKDDLCLVVRVDGNTVDFLTPSGRMGRWLIWSPGTKVWTEVSQ